MDDRPPRPGGLTRRARRPEHSRGAPGGLPPSPQLGPPAQRTPPHATRPRANPPAPTRRPGQPPRRRRVPPAARRRPRLRGPKLFLGLISALVFSLTGYSWSSFQDLQNGLSTTDVIGFSAPDGATDILLVGSDSRTDAQGNPLPPEVLAQLRTGENEGELTDTVILVRIPNDGSRAAAISLPRDMYVRMPEGFGEHKLNSAYARAKGDTEARLVEQGADPVTVRDESISAGRKLLLETVEDLTGVGIDHYAEINLLGFSLLTEAVGGVKVCLRAPVRDRSSGANFPAGQQTISGPDALAFVRQRHGLPRGDLDRVVRQQVFLGSLADQVLSTGTLTNPSRIRELIDATQQSLVLDDNLNVLDFATRIQGITTGDVEFMTVPVAGEAESASDGAVLKVDPKAVRNFVAAAIGSHPPAAPGSSETTRITVDVLNSSGVPGLAAAVAKKLTGQGFSEGTVDNADARRLSVVRYPSGERNTAVTVAESLGGLSVEENPNLPAGTVQVYLGEDYSGPGTKGLVAASLLRLDGRLPGSARPSTIHAAQPPPPGPLVVAGNVPCVD